MKTTSMILSLSLSLLTACGSGGGKDDTADAGGSDCAVYGQQVASFDTCEEDAAFYEENCEAGLSQSTAAGCGLESEAYLQCSNDAEYEYDCSDDGTPTVTLGTDDPCEEELSEYIACAWGG